MRKTQKRWLPQFGLCSFSFSIKYYPLQSNFLPPSLFPTFIWDFMMSPLFGVLFGAICHTFAPKHHSLLMQTVCRFSKKELFCNFPLAALFSFLLWPSFCQMCVSFIPATLLLPVSTSVGCPGISSEFSTLSVITICLVSSTTASI